MLTEEDDVEIHALARRGWSVSAIARHTGRDRKTVRKSLAGGRPVREPAPSCLEPFRESLVARFADDAHVDGTVLYREVAELGLERSYVTFVRELRRRGSIFGDVPGLELEGSRSGSTDGLVGRGCHAGKRPRAGRSELSQTEAAARGGVGCRRGGAPERRAP
jgi:hypothetical protein